MGPARSILHDAADPLYQQTQANWLANEVWYPLVLRCIMFKCGVKLSTFDFCVVHSDSQFDEVLLG